MSMSWILTVQALGGLTTLFPAQVEIQLGLGLFMLGYYFGLSFKEKQEYAMVLAGLLLGGLTSGLVFFGYSAPFTLAVTALYIFAIPAGSLLGIYTPIFNKKRLDAFVKLSINDMLWAFQATVSVGSISAAAASQVEYVVLVVAIVGIGAWRRNDVKVLFESSHRSVEAEVRSD